MPLRPISFSSGGTNNSFLEGFGSGSDIVSKLLNSAKQRQLLQQQAKNEKINEGILQNQAQYAPQLQEIALRKALAEREKADQENKYYPQRQESILAKNEADRRKSEQEGKFLGPLKQAQLDELNARAGKNRAIQSRQETLAPYDKQKIEAYIRHSNAVSNDLNNPARYKTPLGRSYLEQENAPEEQQGAYNAQRQKMVNTSAQIDKASNAQELDKLFSEVNIEPLKKFTGLKGAANLKTEYAKAALGFPTSESFQDYREFQRSTSKLLSDFVRAALRTSVSPGYVEKQLYPITIPTDEIWSSPEEIQKRFDNVKRVFHEAAVKATKELKGGVSTNLYDNSSKISDEELQKAASFYGIS